MQYKESIEKVLFLDIDGVLNRAEYGKDIYEETYADYCVCLHRPSIEALRKLLAKEPDLKIVWISDWAKYGSEARNDNHCYLDPLYALEQFTWWKNRVFGNIYYGQYESAHRNDKLLAIKKFIEYYIVESYAIIDDDKYEKTLDTQHLFNHMITVNHFKSFLEDDLPIVEKILSIPMDRETIHDTLLKLNYEDSFTVNNRYRCSFDFSKYYEKKAPLFTDFNKDDNCPRLYAKVDVLVYDIDNGEHMQGLVVLSIDKDLNNRKDASLYVKRLGDSKWLTGSTLIHLTDIMKNIRNK